MEHKLENEAQAKAYFERAVKTNGPKEIMLFHNQRNIVRTVLAEAAKSAGRKFVEKDLSIVGENELGAIKIDNTIPEWLKEVMDEDSEDGHVLFLREFHMASDKVKDDVLNILIKKEVGDLKFPENMLIVVGVQDEDETARAIAHTHSIEFYRPK